MNKSILYNFFFIPLGKILIKILTIFSSKIKDRENNIKQSLKNLNKLDKNKKNIWFHSASMGEFEQAKPVIELIKKRNPEIQIVASFFSPSGYNNQLNYKFADIKIYLPFDKYSDINYLFESINPVALIIVRYEIWRNLLQISYNKKIPTYLIAATFPRSFLLNKFLKGFTLKNYNYFTKIFTFNDENYDLFREFGLNNLQKSGDPRFDRIINIIENIQNEDFTLKKNLWKENEKVLVAGSTWEKDEDLLLRLINEPEFNILRLVLVPHEPTEKHISELMKKVKNYIFFSEIENLTSEEIQTKLENKILIIDKIGLLLKLYSIADFAYVGGAFGVGVHSITEPAGYGIPVVTGPSMTNSPDAIKLNHLGGLGVINNYESLFNYFEKLFNDKTEYDKISEINKNYIYQNRGESEKIYQEINKINQF